jgi:hypothetical protein
MLETPMIITGFAFQNDQTANRPRIFCDPKAQSLWLASHQSDFSRSVAVVLPKLLLWVFETLRSFDRTMQGARLKQSI